MLPGMLSQATSPVEEIRIADDAGGKGIDTEGTGCLRRAKRERIIPGSTTKVSSSSSWSALTIYVPDGSSFRSLAIFLPSKVALEGGTLMALRR